MIIDKTQQKAISYLPWCDDRTIWSLDIEAGLVERIPFRSDSGLSFHEGKDGMFAVGQPLVNDGRYRITVRSATDPKTELAGLDVSGTRAEFTGDPTVWNFVPKAYLLQSKSLLPEVGLIVLDPANGTVNWHLPILEDTAHDDPGYHFGEGYLGVAQVADQDRLLILRNKESNALLYDPIKRKTVGQVWFSKRGGNLDPHFRTKAPHVLAIAYDSLVVLNYENWSHVFSQQLQPEDAGVRQFLGNLYLPADETRCVIARPFASDVLVISTKDFTVERKIPVIGKPYDVALLSSGRIICRDYQTCRYLDWPVIQL